MLLALLFRLVLRRRLVEEARTQADRGLLGRMEGHAEMDMSVHQHGPYQGQPLMLFHFNQPLAGTLDNDQYWYVAEQIDPVTVETPTVFQARQVVAHFAASGTCIEIGWGNPNSNSRTLADVSVPASAHPPAGALTQWGETFKRYFGIPWVGQSP